MGLLRLLGIEKYLKKVKTYVDEKTASPNWDAKDGEKGYIKNRTHYKKYGVWNNVKVSGTSATISNIAEYAFMELVNSDYNEPITLSENRRYNVRFNGVSAITQITVIPGTNSISIVADNVADVLAFINDRIKPYNVVKLSSEYLPEGLATEEYVDEKVASIKPSLDGVNTTVLKYASNPYPIMLGETLPDDLLSIIINDEDGFIKANIMSLCVANIPDDTAGYDCYYAITGCVPDDDQITLSNGENWYYFDNEKCFHDYDA